MDHHQLLPSTGLLVRVKSPLLITLLFLAVLLVTAGVSSDSTANPLTGKRTPPPESQRLETPPTPTIFSDLIAKTTLLQMQLKQKIATHVRDFKNSGSVAPLLPLFLLSFVYGVVHAAGPGHGKAIAMSYTLASGRGYLAGFSLGGMIAVIHAGSAISLVVILRFILEKTMAKSLDSATQVTQIFSYGLISLIGLYLFSSGIYSLVKTQNRGEHQQPDRMGNYATPFTAALAIGIIPCPGVIMILLFCLSLGQLILGLLLCATVSVGMALTISFSVWISLTGKRVVLFFTGKTEQSFQRTEDLLSCISGLLLTTIGGLLFFASL